jgi:hypothetical protein
MQMCHSASGSMTAMMAQAAKTQARQEHCQGVDIASILQAQSTFNSIMNRIQSIQNRFESWLDWPKPALLIARVMVPKASADHRRTTRSSIRFARSRSLSIAARSPQRFTHPQTHL